MSSSTLDIRISRAWRSVWRHPFGGIGVSFHEPVALTPSGLRHGGDGRLLALQPPPFACPGVCLRKGDAEEPVSTGNCGAGCRAPADSSPGLMIGRSRIPLLRALREIAALSFVAAKIEGITNRGPQWSAMSTRRFQVTVRASRYVAVLPTPVTPRMPLSLALSGAMHTGTTERLRFQTAGGTAGTRQVSQQDP